MDTGYKGSALLACLIALCVLSACGNDQTGSEWRFQEPANMDSGGAHVDMDTHTETDATESCETPPLVDTVEAGESCEDTSAGVCTAEGHHRCDDSVWTRVAHCCDLRVPDIVVRDVQIELIRASGETTIETCRANDGNTTLDVEFVVSNEGNESAVVKCDLIGVWPIRFSPPYIDHPSLGQVWDVPLKGEQRIELAPGERVEHEARFEILTACPAMYYVKCSADAEPAPYVDQCRPWTYNYDPSSWEEAPECDSGNQVGIHIDPDREAEL